MRSSSRRRPEQVAETLRQVITEGLAREVRDPRVGFVTVTGVNDDAEDGNQAYQAVTAAAVSTDSAFSGRNPADVAVINIDDDTAGITVSAISGNTTEAGGSATFTVDYGRPLARGRELVGNILPYDRVWRTGANAATQFTTSAPITLAGNKVPVGTYTLWTVPRTNNRADIILNKQTGQWGTEYDGAQDLFMTRLTTEALATPVEMFTISVVPTDSTRGTLGLEWGPFRWTAPIVVQGSAASVTASSR